MALASVEASDDAAPVSDEPDASPTGDKPSEASAPALALGDGKPPSAPESALACGTQPAEPAISQAEVPVFRPPPLLV